MDIQLYNQIVTKHANTVFKIAYNYCKNKYDAEDVVQNTFLKLLQRKDGFTDEEHIKRWLIRVVINESKNILLFGTKELYPGMNLYQMPNFLLKTKKHQRSTMQ